ncbi:glutamate racemase [Mitsuokella sp. WILCCON 0060]|uniref:glutamate racemase n=1 Tax=unclassified Mitsuokella TaxID=2637239 RepID=UPI003F1247FD
MKIAFFDSGIGGLSVLHHAMRVLPHEQFVFYADEDHVPYGVKTKEEVRGFVKEAFDFLVTCGVKAIVVACNTATSVAVREMRHLYDIPIIGMEPAAKKALDLDGEHRVLVAATPITVKGKKMQILIERFDKDHLVDLLPLPRLVEFAEREEFNSQAVHDYLSEELGRFDLREYSALVLGCTHFNYFKDTMREIMPENMHFVDGNEGTVRELIRQLKARDGLENLPQTVEYYYSGRRVKDDAELARIGRYLKRLDMVYDIH